MKYIYLFFFCFSLILTAQIEPVKQDSTELKYLIVGGDSIAKSVINLNEVIVLPRLKFNSKAERIRYLILKRKTIKVYPYAKLAAERLTALQKRLDELPKKRQIC